MQAPAKLPKALLKELQAEAPFTSRELGRLWTRFRALDTEGSGSISGAVRHLLTDFDTLNVGVDLLVSNAVSVNLQARPDSGTFGIFYTV